MNATTSVAKGLTDVPDPVVELVDDLGRANGRASKSEAHAGAGRMHRAFSLFLIDPDGRLLLQRRAAGKYHSAGLWSNSCCGHPAPGEGPAAAAVRRLGEELGGQIGPAELDPAGTIAYSVTDPISGVVEREFNHLFVGLAPRLVRPDPREVAEVAYVPVDALDVTQRPGEFTAWFPIVLEAARPAIEARAASGSARSAADP